MIYVPMLKLFIFNIRIKQINDAYRPYSILKDHQVFLLKTRNGINLTI